jgi:hypothetical protein
LETNNQLVTSLDYGVSSRQLWKLSEGERFKTGHVLCSMWFEDLEAITAFKLSFFLPKRLRHAVTPKIS